MQEFMDEVVQKLIGFGIDADIITKVTDTLYVVLHDYDLEKKNTEIVPYQVSKNEKLCKIYAATLRMEGKSEGTIKNYVYELNKLADSLQKDFDTITEMDIRFYMSNKLCSGTKDTTVNHLRSVYNAFFNWLAYSGYIPKSPCLMIKPLKCKKEHREELSTIDLDDLRSGCKNVKQRMTIEFLLATGCRANEAINVKLSDIDFDAKTVLVREGKGGKQRVVLLTPVATKYIKEYVYTRKHKSEYLFINDQYGEQLSYGGLRDIIKRISSGCEVDHVHAHRFRRTLATGLSNRGMPIQEVKQLLGHTNINTTMKYVNVNDTAVRYSFAKYAY